MLSNRIKDGRRKMSTRKMLYNMYCMERWDRHKTWKYYFYERLNTWFTYSQLVEQKEWEYLKRVFTRDKSLWRRKEQYWKEYYKEYLNSKEDSKL